MKLLFFITAWSVRYLSNGVAINIHEGVGDGPPWSFVDENERPLDPRERRALCIALRKMTYKGPCLARQMKEFLEAHQLTPQFFKQKDGKLDVMFEGSYENMALTA
ncbi:MAG TPA: hypothetical protein VHE10_01660 [Candidatus Paceibacterota bacterium]|nr:hypothetical protein [Candidatus Paceibacterota bacterium]